MTSNNCVSTARCGCRKRQRLLRRRREQRRRVTGRTQFKSGKLEKTAIENEIKSKQQTMLTEMKEAEIAASHTGNELMSWTAAEIGQYRFNSREGCHLGQ